jgi:Flp pilus assembly pilin Flp
MDRQAIHRLRTSLAEAWRDERAVTAIEYALLAALIVIAAIAAFSVTGTSLEALYVYWSAKVIAVL